jgi:hypothetical protein
MHIRQKSRIIQTPHTFRLPPKLDVSIATSNSVLLGTRQNRALHKGPPGTLCRILRSFRPPVLASPRKHPTWPLRHFPFGFANVAVIARGNWPLPTTLPSELDYSEPLMNLSRYPSAMLLRYFHTNSTVFFSLSVFVCKMWAVITARSNMWRKKFFHQLMFLLWHEHYTTTWSDLPTPVLSLFWSNTTVILFADVPLFNALPPPLHHPLDGEQAIKFEWHFSPFSNFSENFRWSISFLFHITVSTAPF